MKVYFKNGRTWYFLWSDEHKGLVCRGIHDTYKLFVNISGDNCNRDEIDIYIGKLRHIGSTKVWVPCEEELGIKRIEFLRGTIEFKRRK